MMNDTMIYYRHLLNHRSNDYISHRNTFFLPVITFYTNSKTVRFISYLHVEVTRQNNLNGHFRKRLNQYVTLGL